jgi:predicted MFS family arabinose efflux permease
LNGTNRIVQTKDLAPRLIAFTLTRTVLNTAHRMVYPFLTAFARGLGVDLGTLSYIMSARSLVAAVGPLVASLTDRIGRKVGVLVGLGLFTVGATLLVFFPSLLAFAATLILMSFGKYIFDISLTSWIGDRVPYQRRGRVLAVTEFGWSLAFILGVPLVGFLLARGSWQSPFLPLACAGAAAFIIMTLIIPRDRPLKDVKQESLTERISLPVLLRSPLLLPVIASLLLGLFASAANETVNFLFGAWLEDAFGLKIAALGAASAVIGAAELGGEGLVAAFVDRLGKPRAVALGLIINSLSAVLLPLLGSTEAGALIGLFFFYISFEFTLVSSIPLMTEINPRARGLTLSLNVAGLSLGRALGALASPQLYSHGFSFVAGSAIAFNLLALVSLSIVSRRMPPAGHQEEVQ